MTRSPRPARPASAACFEDNRVTELLAGALAPSARRSAEQHLDECGRCRTLVAAVARVTPLPAEDEDLEDTEPSAEPSRLPAPGDRVADRFRIVRQLGRGGMGAVFEAEDLLLGVKVALKVLTPQLAAHDEGRTLVRKEVRLARRIHHPNVCRIHDLVVASGVPCISMELLPGTTLDVRLQRGHPGLDEAVSILRQVLSALSAAHRQAVIHRDLKPANIMLAPDGHVTVMDFGLARDLAASERSISGNPVGTPMYWSPEQARGEQATSRSDLYAVGMVALRLLVQPSGPIVDPPAMVELVPRRLRGFVRRCLQPDPEDRFQSAEQAQAALPAPGGMRPGRLALGMGALAAVGLAVVGVLHAPRADRAAPAEPPPRTAPDVQAAPASGGPAAANGTHGPAPVTRVLPAAATPLAPPAAAGSAAEGRAPPKRRKEAAVRTAPPAVVAPAPTTGPTSDQLRARHQELLASFRARHLVPEDAPAFWSGMKAVDVSLERGELEGTPSRLDELERQLAAVVVDESFVKAKLERLTRRAGARSLAPEVEKAISAAFARVHSAYFDGLYQDANRHLTHVSRLMEESR
jgi:hypothetical protein